MVAAISSGRIPAWTWHSPIQICMFAAGHDLEPRPQEHVGQEQDLVVLRNRADHDSAFPPVQQ